MESKAKPRKSENPNTILRESLIKQEILGEILGVLALPVPVGLPVLLGGLVCALSGSLRRKS